MATDRKLDKILQQSYQMMTHHIGCVVSEIPTYSHNVWRGFYYRRYFVWMLQAAETLKQAENNGLKDPQIIINALGTFFTAIEATQQRRMNSPERATMSGDEIADTGQAYYQTMGHIRNLLAELHQSQPPIQPALSCAEQKRLIAHFIPASPS